MYDNKRLMGIIHKNTHSDVSIQLCQFLFSGKGHLKKEFLQNCMCETHSFLYTPLQENGQSHKKMSPTRFPLKAFKL